MSDTTTWRQAGLGDLPAVIELLRDDTLGAARESGDPQAYVAGFERMALESGNLLIVGERGGIVVATYQITFISGLSLQAARRLQIESVRVSRALRGGGVGRAMLADAEARARAEGCTLIQLTTNASRTRTHSFYRRAGFTASHIGFKRVLT